MTEQLSNSSHSPILQLRKPRPRKIDIQKIVYAKHEFHLNVIVAFWPHHAACRILVSQPGTERRLWQWKHWVLTTRLPGNSLMPMFFWSKLCSLCTIPNCLLYFLNIYRILALRTCLRSAWHIVDVQKYLLNEWMSHTKFLALWSNGEHNLLGDVNM